MAGPSAARAPPASPSSCPSPLTHRTRDLPVPLEHTEAVDVAGVGGGGAAGLLRDAARRLVPHKPGLAGTALVGALGEGGQGQDEGAEQAISER